MTDGEYAGLADPPATWIVRHAWQAAAICQLVVIALGFIYQLLGGRIAVPFPWNWGALLFLIVVAGALGIIYRRTPGLCWFSGAPFAVTIITLVAAIGLLGTLIVQEPERADALAKLGLRALFTSPPFAAAIALMLCHLAATIGRRLATPRRGQIGFLLNHVGLLLVILGMFAGAAQFIKLILSIHEGETVQQGVDERGTMHDISGTVALNKFEIEKFPPKLIAAEFTGMKEKTISDSDWVATGRHFKVYGTEIYVEQYLPIAFPGDHGEWVATASHGLPAALLRITVGGKQKKAWVTSGITSLGIIPQSAEIDPLHAVGLEEAQPKAFRSHLTITPSGGSPHAALLEVNQPVKLGDWQLYQSSYEQTMGGRVSIIQAVRDPALPMVYFGLIMMGLGAFVALWITPAYRRQPEVTTTADETTEAQR